MRNLVFACLFTPALGDTVTGVATIGNDLASFNVTGADMGAYTAWPMYVLFIGPVLSQTSPSMPADHGLGYLNMVAASR